MAIDEALGRLGTGPSQRRLLVIFGLVWAADAMQVLAVGGIEVETRGQPLDGEAARPARGAA